MVLPEPEKQSKRKTKFSEEASKWKSLEKIRK